MKMDIFYNQFNRPLIYFFYLLQHMPLYSNDDRKETKRKGFIFIYFSCKIEPLGMNAFCEISTQKSFGSHSENLIYIYFIYKRCCLNCNCNSHLCFVFLMLLKGNMATFTDVCLCAKIYRIWFYVRQSWCTSMNKVLMWYAHTCYSTHIIAYALQPKRINLKGKQCKYWNEKKFLTWIVRISFVLLRKPNNNNNR